LKIDGDYKQKLFEDAIDYAIQYDQLDFIKECLKLATTPIEINNVGYSIYVQTAIKNGYSKLIKYIIECGLVKDLKSVAYYASKFGQLPIVQWLLENNDIDKLDIKRAKKVALQQDHQNIAWLYDNLTSALKKNPFYDENDDDDDDDE
jgi:hypothetical protein